MNTSFTLSLICLPTTPTLSFMYMEISMRDPQLSIFFVLVSEPKSVKETADVNSLWY